MRAAQNPENRSDTEQNFFLPNLCAPYSVLALVLTVELFVLVIMLGALGLADFSWEFLAVTSFFAQWVVLLSAAVLCRARGWLQTLPTRWAVAACFVVILSVTGALSLPGDWIVQGMPDESMFVSLQWNHVARNLLIAAIVAGMALRYFYVQSELRRRERAELEARIQALQSRIRPHFLFNSINGVASLIGSDPDLAEVMLEDLSELFRASLGTVVNQVPLRDELDLCRRYARIEKLRLRDRLQLRWDLAEIPPVTPVPLLTLQPLIENAIYHGIQLLPEGGEVLVQGALRGDRVHFKVRNPVGPAQTDSHGNRMSLANIRNRLQALYGPDASVELSRSEGVFEVALEYGLPAEHAELSAADHSHSSRLEDER